MRDILKIRFGNKKKYNQKTINEFEWLHKQVTAAEIRCVLDDFPEELKTGEITNVVLPFQTIEQVDEPRKGDSGEEKQVSLFDFEVLYGDLNTALDLPFSIILTDSRGWGRYLTFSFSK